MSHCERKSRRKLLFIFSIQETKMEIITPLFLKKNAPKRFNKFAFRPSRLMIRLHIAPTAAISCSENWMLMGHFNFYRSVSDSSRPGGNFQT